MKDNITEVFKERVLDAAKKHSEINNSVQILNDIFYLKQGMFIKDIEKAMSTCIEKVNDELYCLVLSSSIEGINKLYFWINKESGLYSVFAINENIECDGFALNLKKTFFGYEKILEVGYGKFNHIESGFNNLNVKYNEWLKKLESGAISLETYFNKEAGSNLKNNLKQIYIGAAKEVNERASIVIVYKFNNSN